MNRNNFHNDGPHRVPAISPLRWRWFCAYGRRFLRRSFHAVRLDQGGPAPVVDPALPLIVYANHPSWWDPMVGIFLAQSIWPERRHYWPIDSTMLARYRFFGRLGFFGIEQNSPRGGASFLRTARAILGQPGACLWITAQGEFADVRRRPIVLRPGLSHLLHRLDRGVVVPLAVEYPFWSERTPEVLLRFGEAMPVDAGTARDASAWQPRLEAALEAAQDALAARAIARDALQFTTLLQGATGTSWIYDAWRRLKAGIAGRRFDAAHLPEAQAQEAQRS